MIDTLSEAERSIRMSLIKGRDTGPELAVRRIAFSMGYRYRLHSRDLPGKPDLTFRSRRKAIFVNGCFWHQHPGCAFARMPKSNLAFWESKLSANASRDLRNLRQLQERGWECLVIWECETKDPVAVQRRIRRFLDPSP